MNNIVKMSLVALVVMAAAVSNSMALPRQAPTPCTPAESQAMQDGVAKWAAGVLAQSASPEAAAESVLSSFDSNGDGTLSGAEFVAGLKIAVDDSSISENCFDFMSVAGDANGDGSVGLTELSQLFNMVAAAGRKGESSARGFLKRQDVAESACPQADSELLLTAISKWLSGLLSEFKTPAGVVAQIKDTCDHNDDSSLTADEFVSCLQTKLSSNGISDKCFAMLLQYADQEGDKIIDDAELLQLVNMVVKP